jgi:hypothetical protein
LKKTLILLSTKNNPMESNEGSGWILIGIILIIISAFMDLIGGGIVVGGIFISVGVLLILKK